MGYNVVRGRTVMIFNIHKFIQNIIDYGLTAVLLNYCIIMWWLKFVDISKLKQLFSAIVNNIDTKVAVYISGLGFSNYCPPTSNFLLDLTVSTITFFWI